MFFTYDHLVLRYEPFPIGLAKPLMEPGLYQELLADVQIGVISDGLEQRCRGVCGVHEGILRPMAGLVKYILTLTCAAQPCNY